MDLKGNSISEWNVPNPGVRLGFAVALGILGAWFFPVEMGFFPNAFANVVAADLVVWLMAAVVGALLLRRMAKSTQKWVTSPTRALGIALAAPLLLFASRPDRDDQSVRPVLALSRAALAGFPFVLLAGFTVGLALEEFSRNAYVDRAGLVGLSFSLWTWLGCALLFLLTPWPTYPRKLDKGDRPRASKKGIGGLVGLVAVAIVTMLAEGSFFRELFVVFFPPIWIAGGLLLMLGPWLGYLGVPKMGALPEQRRLPALATAVYIGLVLVPLAWFFLGPILYVLSGQLFASSFDHAHIGGALDQPSLHKWFFLSSQFAAVALPCVAIARWMADRRSRAGYCAFALPAAVLCLCVLSVFTVPFWWVIQYIGAMGFTPRRILGLACGLGGYIVILGILRWALTPPKRLAPTWAESATNQ
ncbi:MAG TPA: hypothetical protein VMZ31_03645 [Phycisphaerae bacterium]|nr:hypothetical protein [Phycisphaerae bacterium]